MHLMGSVNKQFPCWKNFGFRQVLKNTQSSDGGVGGRGSSGLSLPSSPPLWCYNNKVKANVSWWQQY